MPMRVGYGVITEPGKPDIELNSVTCNHCSGLVFMKKLESVKEKMGFCHGCMHHICKSCAEINTKADKCIPIERNLEIMEARDRFYQAVQSG